jgi:amino acid transporter
MIYAVSRQSFSLGRAGYLPRALGQVHPTRRTPHVSLAVWTAVTIVFIIFGHFYEKATALAILISTLTAVIWYVLAMLCLIILRRREPELFRPYKVPCYPSLPIFVAVLSGIAGCLYAWANVQVIVPTAILYVAAGIWYAVWARRKVLPVAPEEVAARLAQQLAAAEAPAAEVHVAAAGSGSVVSRGTETIPVKARPHSRQVQTILERISAPFLAIGILSLVWMILRARGVVPGLFSEKAEVTSVIALWSLLFFLVSAVGLLSTRNNGSDQSEPTRGSAADLGVRPTTD